jgi:hypothetical protein
MRVPRTRRRVARGARLLVAVPLAATALVLAATAPALASAPWWQLAAFSGQNVSRVAVVQGRVTALVGDAAMAQTSTGFVAAAAPPPLAPATVTTGSSTWSIDAAGEVLVAQGGGAARRDPGSPNLGAGAHLIAAPLAIPGFVVAVNTGGTVWRRAPDGGWSVSLALLPATLITGTPAVTSIAGFNTSTVSGVVYIGTAGYGTLLTSDVGDDWVRADPGLPDDVLSLAADTSGAAPAIWAGTSQGLYVHQLRAVPYIPNYSGGSLTGKWLITIVLCLGVIVLAGLALVVWSNRRVPAEDHKSPT